MRTCLASSTLLSRSARRAIVRLKVQCKLERCRYFQSATPGAASRAATSIQKVVSRNPTTSKTRGSPQTRALQDQIQRKRKHLLEQVYARLPQRLREDYTTIPTTDDPESDDNAQALGSLLLQGPDGSGVRVDVLYELAVVQNQWRAAVWIVQRLLSIAGRDARSDNALSQLVERADAVSSLKTLTESPIAREAHVSDAVQPQTGTIDDLIGGPELMITAWYAEKSHQALGCVWESLGLMTLRCAEDLSVANGSVKAEILEMLALFHHHGFIPRAVYAYEAASRSDAIQQPPTLYLLSTHIMNALTDAAWRARETTALEQVKKSGGDINAIRLELLGSAVRANHRKVKPEMWLELILWSCLYGGWLNSGINILDVVTQRRGAAAWKPISWRQNLTSALELQTKDVDWAKLQTTLSLDDESSASKLQVQQTLSSELVNAYIEGLTDWALPRSNELGIGVKVMAALKHLQTLRDFLRRTSTNLHVGTWDTTMLRFLDYNTELEQRQNAITELVKLAPEMGEETLSDGGCNIPAEVLDGSAAVLGILHRALRVQIDTGRIAGAMRIVYLIRGCIDSAKQRSLEDFFSSNLLMANADLSSTAHGTNVPPTALRRRGGKFLGIEYPKFEAQIPPSTMSSLLDLIVRSGELKLGEALLIDSDVGSPLLPMQYYGNPDLAPALARYAAAVKDEKLLSKVIRARLTASTTSQSSRKKLEIDPVMSIMLSEQFTAARWDLVQQLSERMQRANICPDPHTIAVMGSLFIKRKYATVKESNDMSQEAWSAFQNTACGTFVTDAILQKQYVAELSDVVRLLSIVDKRFSQIARSMRNEPHMHSLDAGAFNAVLKAVVAAQGSAYAQALVQTFTTAASKFAITEEKPGFWSGAQRIAASPRSTNSGHNIRSPVYSVNDACGEQISVTRRLMPDLATYNVVLKQGLLEGRARARQRKAQGETQHLDAEVKDLIHWAIRGMFDVERNGFRVDAESIQEEIQKLADTIEMPGLADEFESIVSSAMPLPT